MRLTTYHHPVALSRNPETLTSWNPLGLSRPVMGAALPLDVLEGIFFFRDPNLSVVGREHTPKLESQVKAHGGEVRGFVQEEG